MNTNLLSASRHAQQIMTELCEARVTILAARIDMDYNTPDPFRFYIQAWNDENFLLWSAQYHTNVNKRTTTVPFNDGQVFAIHG